MFGKDKVSKELLNSSEMETVIGADTVVQGTVTSKGALRVDGKLEGGITNASAVIVGEKGEVQGDVTALSVVIGGKVIGNVAASTAIEILPNAQLHGDIKTADLSIEKGAIFEGNCTITKEKQVIEMDISAGAMKGRR